MNGTSTNRITKESPGYATLPAVVCPELKFGGFLGLIDSTGEYSQEDEEPYEEEWAEEPESSIPERPDLVCSMAPNFRITKLLVGCSPDSSYYLVCSSVVLLTFISYF